MAGCMRARWQLLGSVGVAWSRMEQEFKTLGRQGPDQGQGAVRGQIGAAMARWLWGTVGKILAVGHWGGIPERAWDGVSDT